MPVDPDELGIPIYKEIIKNPMDLSTIYTKLKQMKYETINQILNDINLIWDNCKKFNEEGSAIWLRANIMNEKCKKYCFQNNILPIKRLRSNTKTDHKVIYETGKKYQCQDTKNKKSYRFCNKKENSVKDEKINSQKCKEPAEHLKIPKNPEVLKEKMSQFLIKKIPTENCELLKTKDYNDNESKYENIKSNQIIKDNQTIDIARSRQIKLKKAISVAPQKKFQKVIQVIKQKSPNAFEVTRDNNLIIFIRKLTPQLFEEIWALFFNP
ncbi:hypothetical protein SteCoe_790 [Stentor coeruleus]|uniref:Bromo domain-containing protein n=1 Tax=Stentor coeruleus TaxID=5963 RepID=A0A1R2D380_9CILI|nr:hypothetical protein SteCoe_790 [Stentor coeruleus]